MASNGTKYQIRTAITMPRNSRRVYCPVSGSDERVVSDLIPVDAITPEFPLIGQRYGDINWLNQPQDNYYEDYVLREIRPEGDLFSRLVFSREIVDENGNDDSLNRPPFKRREAHDDKYWAPILHDIYFIPDKNFPLVTRGPNGNIITAYRHYKRQVYTPGAHEGTKYVIESFIHTVEPKIPRYPTPVLGNVSYDFLEAEGSFPECFHDDLRIGPQQTAFASYNANTNTTTAISGALQGQFFPATNFITWRPYVKKHTVEEVDVLYVSTRVTVYPPSLPEVVIA